MCAFPFHLGHSARGRAACLTRAAWVAAAALGSTTVASAADDCARLPHHAALKNALVQAVAAEGSGLNLNMWATVVDRSGVVCAVAFSGNTFASQWLGSRVISAQKANTANAFSLDPSSVANSSGKPNGLALSTANLYSAVQPGGSLFGLQESNPVDPRVAYRGVASLFGQPNDPMVGERIGGINVFGGGLGLYAAARSLVGGLGVSGDTSCADHNIAWRVRNLLQLDRLQGVDGVSGDPAHPDNIIFLDAGEAPNGFKHPQCPGTDLNVGGLPAVRP